jgi:hypothetical protein
MADQTAQPEQPRAYGRQLAQPDGWRVMTTLRPDAHAAVQRVMDELSISASGAVHHLVRLGAGLDPLN